MGEREWPKLRGKPRALYRTERRILEVLAARPTGEALAMELVEWCDLEFGTVHRVCRTMHFFGVVKMTELTPGEVPKIGKFHPRWHVRITAKGMTALARGTKTANRGGV